MDEPRSPREVFLALVHGVADGRWEELPDLYAEQTDVSHPFDPLRAPALRSRDEIRRHFGLRDRSNAADGAQRRRRQVGNVVVHDTADPEVIVAEFEYQGTDPESGEAYALPAIFVLRVRDGEIVSSRDYHDPLAWARVRGKLPELFAAVTAQTAGAGRTPG
jgi:uncharacterized protein